MLSLVKMQQEYQPLLDDMMCEWQTSDPAGIPLVLQNYDYENPNKWLSQLEYTYIGREQIPCTTFFLFDDEKSRFLGVACIRHHLNRTLLHGYGHIGEGIRPSARGQGYGTKLIALAIAECRKMGIDDILLCCVEENIASARTFEKNGAVLENIVLDDGLVICRYWVKK